MWASGKGHHDIVRTLLEAKADLNAQDKVRNQNDDNNNKSYILFSMMMMTMSE